MKRSGPPEAEAVPHARTVIMTSLRGSWPARGLLVAAVLLTGQGSYYAVKDYQEHRFVREVLVAPIEQLPPGKRLEQTLRVAFQIPPHKPPAPAPDYGLSNPALRVLGPPASLIQQNGGHCGRRSRLLIALLAEQAIPARKIHLINQDYHRFGHASEYVHSVVEAKIGDRWAVLDPLYNIIYRNSDGSYASLEDIRANPEVFRRGLASADTRFTPYYPTLYTYTQYRKFIWSSLPGGNLLYGILERLVSPDRAREIPTPAVLESPYAAMVLLSFSGALLSLVGWFWLAGVDRRRSRAGLVRVTPAG